MYASDAYVSEKKRKLKYRQETTEIKSTNYQKVTDSCSKRLRQTERIEGKGKKHGKMN